MWRRTPPLSAQEVVFIIAPASAGISTLAENLPHYGFDVRVFEDHDSALRALPDQPPNACIARLHPSQAVADICDATKVLRQKIPVSVPVLWVVDRADSETRLNILRAGGDGCIQEPVPTASTASRLRKLIPAVDGLELAHLLRQKGALQTIPIVLLCEAPDLVENRHRFRQLELKDLRLSDVRVRLGMTEVGPDGDARAALCEAAMRYRSTVKTDQAARDGIEDAAKPENTAARTPILDAAGRKHWSSRIRDAILGKKLFLMFQPMFPVRGNDAIQRYEVLLRIRDDNGGVSLPSETLAMAEQLGMSVLLDRWVIDTALGMLSTHRKTSPNTTFFLKVTGDTIQDDHFLEWLEETVHRRALDPGSVVMQVRETDAVAQRQRTQEMVQRLREQEIAVGLEHFGLRTTSFELLLSLNVDFVKLDRALVQGLADGAQNAPSTLKLLHQTRARGVKIIVPYIENADSLAKLWNERVDLLQGNFLQGPEPDLAYDPDP